MDKRPNHKTCVVMAVLLAAIHCATAAGDVIYVDDDAPLGGDGNSWPTAYKYLQDALYRPPSAGDQIWVAAGTYKPDQDEAGNVTPGERSETFQLTNGVGLYGGFAGNEDPCSFDMAERDYDANETVLSGDIKTPGDKSDNSYHVVTGSWTDANAVLDGFTITHGNANGGSYPSDHGGGMFNRTGSPTIVNSTFRENSARSSAAGAFGECCGSGAGMFNGFNSNPTVINCIFSNNACDWGGGGIANGDGSSPTVTNCIFSGNHAGNHGGGMANWSSCVPNLTNCTFTGNQAAIYGGGINSANWCHPKLTNCILWGDTAIHGDEIALRDEPSYGPSWVTVCYSNIEGGPNDVYVDPPSTVYWGEGNIDQDPCFVDPNGPDNDPNTCEDNDYRLRSMSPCIDAGDNTKVPPDKADLDEDGNTVERTPLDLDNGSRFTDDLATIDSGVPDPPDYNDIVDMGAYEYLSKTCWDPGECTGQPEGDATCDGTVNLADLFALKAYFAKCAPWTDPECCADFNQDECVNLGDLFALKAGFGTGGYSPSTGNQVCPR